MEKKFYLVNADNYDNIYLMSDEEFMDIAEENGDVYSMEGFQEAFNMEDVSTANQFLRIL